MKNRAIYCWLAILFILFPLAVKAGEDKLTLGVTPPFFQVSLEPGSTWKSSLKAVNGNSYDLILYASLMNFTSEGEEGQGKLAPFVAGAENVNDSLASWFSITRDPIVVPAQKSVDIPFLVHVPVDAPPGGYYVAILVGTAPLDGMRGGGSLLKVSSAITSLVFARVQGEVEESGGIREFFSSDSFVQNPETSFVLRFENTGNVHLQPQGEIIIYNMWGKERGKIFVNQNSEYGNVMPGSVRKFIYDWRGEGGLYDIGRNQAVITLTFGATSRQNVAAVVNFWVIPIKPILIGLFCLAVFAVLFFLSIKVYVRKIVGSAVEKKTARGSVDNKKIRQNHLFLIFTLLAYVMMALWVCWKLLY